MDTASPFSPTAPQRRASEPQESPQQLKEAADIETQLLWVLVAIVVTGSVLGVFMYRYNVRMKQKRDRALEEQIDLKKNLKRVARATAVLPSMILRNSTLPSIAEGEEGQASSGGSKTEEGGPASSGPQHGGDSARIGGSGDDDVVIVVLRE